MAAQQQYTDHEGYGRFTEEHATRFTEEHPAHLATLRNALPCLQTDDHLSTQGLSRVLRSTNKIRISCDGKASR